MSPVSVPGANVEATKSSSCARILKYWVSLGTSQIPGTTEGRQSLGQQINIPHVHKATTMRCIKSVAAQHRDYPAGYIQVKVAIPGLENGDLLGKELLDMT